MTDRNTAMNARELTRLLGGDWHGSYGLCPGPNHSGADRSLKVFDGRRGLVFHSFAGEDWRHIKDALRVRGLLPNGDEGQTDLAEVWNSGSTPPSRPQRDIQPARTAKPSKRVVLGICAGTAGLGTN